MKFWRRESDIARISELTAERDGLVSERDGLVSERDGLVSERDGLVSERDCLVSERDVLIAERDGLIAERDGLIAERDGLIAERDGLIAERNDLAKKLEMAQTSCTCNICGHRSEFKFGGRILDKYDIRYYLCSNCGHLQTEKPYWLDEAYGSAISVSDTGIVLRNEYTRDVTKAVIATFFDRTATVLEYAGGYGLLTRMLRDGGVDCRWQDKYEKPVFATGFEDDGNRQYDIVTAFEALEHFADPMAELKSIFKRTGTLIFSEELLPDPVPSPSEWWYYCLEHGQHINLYSRKTLEYFAAHFGKRLVYHGSIGMLTDKDIDEDAFAQCIDNCHETADAYKCPGLAVSDMQLMIDKMANAK